MKLFFDIVAVKGEAAAISLPLAAASGALAKYGGTWPLTGDAESATMTFFGTAGDEWYAVARYYLAFDTTQFTVAPSQAKLRMTMTEDYPTCGASMTIGVYMGSWGPDFDAPGDWDAFSTKIGELAGPFLAGAVYDIELSSIVLEDLTYLVLKATTESAEPLDGFANAAYFYGWLHPVLLVTP